MTAETPDEEYYDILEWPDGEEESGPEEPARPVSIVLQMESKDGIFQSFSIMSGDTIQVQLTGYIEGQEVARMTTIPVSITARLA